MRLDTFLRRTGLLKQRTLAKEACEKGRVRVDGCTAKASREIAPGRVIALDASREFLEIEVVGLPNRNYKRQDGQVFYRVKQERHKEAL